MKTSKRRFKKISAGFLAVIIPSVVIALVVFGLFSYVLQRRNLLNQYSQTSQLLTNQINGVLRDWIEDQIRIAETIAADPRVITALENPQDPEARRSADEYLEALHDRYPYYENLPLAVKLAPGETFTMRARDEDVVINDGTFITDTVEDRTIGKCGTNFSYIKNVYEGKPHFISEVYPSILRGNPIFVISTPVQKDGRLLGVAVVAPQMDYFTRKFVDDSVIGETGHMSMIDERGLLIAHPDQSLILNQDKVELLEPVMEKIQQGEYSFTESFDGARRNYVVSAFDAEGMHLRYQWYMMYSQNYDEILLEAASYLKMLVVFMVVLMLIINLIIVLMTRRRISRPFKRIIGVMDAVARGDLSADIDVGRSDETGQILLAIKNTVGNLRTMVQQIKQSADQVATSSEELSANAQQLATGSQSQASTLEETSAAVEELNASVEQVSDHAQNQAAAVEESSSNMQQMQQSVDQVSTTLSQVSNSSQRSMDTAQSGAQDVKKAVEAIKQISSTSDRITGIVNVISEIAEQTNLLALNASIEAARAGEHGRGFAVVADEVSKLAERSSASTKEIEDLINESSRNVSLGVEIAQAALGSMDEIISGARETNEVVTALAKDIEQQINAIGEVSRATDDINEMSQSISAATVQQSTNAKQVATAIETVNELTQAAASAAEEMNASTDELSALSQQLQKLVDQFHLAEQYRSEAGRELPQPKVFDVHDPRASAELSSEGVDQKQSA